MQDCLMQDVEKPSRRNCLLGDEQYPISSIKHELPTFKDGMQFDDGQCKTTSLYDEDRHDNFWNGISYLLRFTEMFKSTVFMICFSI